MSSDWIWEEPYPGWGSSDSGQPEVWLHGGVAVSASDELLIFNRGTRELVTFDATGELRVRWSPGLAEVHGIALAEPSGGTVWLADPGLILDFTADGAVSPRFYESRVANFTVDGTYLGDLEQPPASVAPDGYRPTSIVSCAGPFGGPDDLWVADGYGSSRVHRFSGTGEYRATIDGSPDGGRFACPHGLAIRWSAAEPELYVFDRGNRQLQVFTLGGEFIRLAASADLPAPSAGVEVDDHLYVANLHGSIVELDQADRYVATLFPTSRATDDPGWPNHLDPSAGYRRPELTPTAFNSPHDIAADSSGRLYVTEWVLGGRLVRLSSQRTLRR